MTRQPIRGLLLCAFGCVGAAATTGALAFEWPAARSYDAKTLAGFIGLTSDATLGRFASLIADAMNPISYVLAGVALVVVALVRGRRRLAIAMPITIVAATESSELLKRAITQERRSHWLAPHHQLAPGSWPSGHATATMIVVLCAVMVAPMALRPLIALLGAALTMCASFAILTLAWHFPSDVLGGFLVAATWAWLMAAAVSWSERQRPPPHRPVAEQQPHMRTLLPAAGLAAAGASAVVIRVALGPVHVPIGRSLIAGAIAIAIAAAVLTGWVAAALRPLAGHETTPFPRSLQ